VAGVAIFLLRPGDGMAVLTMAIETIGEMAAVAVLFEKAAVMPTEGRLRKGPLAAALRHRPLQHALHAGMALCTAGRRPRESERSSPLAPWQSAQPKPACAPLTVSR